MKILKNILDNIKIYSISLIYLCINSLFIIKYGEKYGITLLIFYLITVLGLSIFYLKIEFKNIVYKSLFWILLISFFLVSIGLNYFVDGKSLNVDRWDAMEIVIRTVFEGKYPYDIPDYMGRRSSNLPFLTILGMPFYLIFGSVGYLQSFSFLLFSFIIFKIFKVYKHRLAVLVLLLLSPSYLWEIYVKSDLFSNFIIVVGFVFLIWKYFIEQRKIGIELIGFLTALIFLTRLSVVIPIIILLFSTFYRFSFTEKLRFILIFILTAGSILFLFFYHATDLNMIFKYNPFTIQGTKQPLLLSVFFLMLSLVLSFKLKSFRHLVYWIGFLLFTPVFISFILYLREYGCNNAIINSYFDLSFFNMSMPFVIVAIVLEFFVKNHKEYKI